MNVCLLLTTINEEIGMRAIVPLIDRTWVDQIIVSDYKSTDSTVAFAQEQEIEVVHQQQPGLRRAFIEALPFIHGDIVICFSPDGNSLPEKFQNLSRK
jgi:glycosyltransferase involved in cell wall biosynthesis